MTKKESLSLQELSDLLKSTESGKQLADTPGQGISTLAKGFTLKELAELGITKDMLRQVLNNQGTSSSSED